MLNKIPRLLAALLATACLAACVSTPDLAATVPPAAPQPHFDAFAFFTGRLIGEGRLAKAFSGTVSTHVESRGTTSGDALHLVQRLKVDDGDERTREWVIRKVGPDRYAGTLTDADGPVTGEVAGNRLHLSYTAKKGDVAIDQWLTLSPDASRAYNVLKARKFGVTVAALAENIRKVD